MFVYFMQIATENDVTLNYNSVYDDSDACTVHYAIIAIIFVLSYTETIEYTIYLYGIQ
jgi:hypothetical protein